MKVHLFEAVMISPAGTIITRKFGVLARTDHNAYVRANRSALRRYRSYWGRGVPKSMDLRTQGVYPMEDLT